MFYDIEKIKEELRPIMIILYLSVRYIRRGKNIYILCPDHERKTGRADQNIGNCVLGNTFYNAYHCFGCGATGNCFQLIASLASLDAKKDFRKILEIASEACGGKELFSSHHETMSKRKNNIIEEKNLNILSKDQLQLIGLNIHSYPYIYTEYFSDNQKIDVDGLIKDADYHRLDNLGFPSISYLTQKWLNYSINSVLNSSEETYSFIVKHKAKEAMEKYKNFSNRDWKQFADKLGMVELYNLDYFCEKLKDVYKNKYLEAESIWKMFATDEELEELDDNWVYEYDEIIEKKPGAIL